MGSCTRRRLANKPGRAGSSHAWAGSVCPTRWPVGVGGPDNLGVRGRGAVVQCWWGERFPPAGWTGRPMLLRSFRLSGERPQDPRQGTREGPHMW